MIEEEKVEKAADAYLLGIYEENVIGDSNFKDVPKAFKAGINWLLGNLWHDVKEEPEQNKPLLVQYKKRGDTYFTTIEYEPSNEISWHDLVIEDGITKWCYIEDLLKGGE